MSVPRSLTSVFRNATTILSVLIVYSFCLLLSISAYAVDCLPDTGLRTQADVDNFQTDYGPCDTITQHLTIDGGPYANLDGLNGIITMTDGLTIEFTSVASLAGLSNLVTIGGRFQSHPSLGAHFHL